MPFAMFQRFACLPGVVLRTVAKSIAPCVLLLVATGAARAQAPAADRPSESECRRLYRHQLEVATADVQNPLVAPMFVRREELARSDAENASIAFCRNYVTRSSMQCQLATNSFPELVACQSRHGRTPSPEELATQGEGNPAEPESDRDSPGQGTTSTTVDTGPASLPDERVPATASNCSRAYDHMLEIIVSGESFRARPDGQRLLEHWNSAPAREAFVERCQSRFAPNDVGCILGAREHAILQACLLSIPADSPGI